MIIVVERNDDVAAMLMAVSQQLVETREECRDIDDVITCRAGGEVHDARASGAILDPDLIGAVAE